MALRWSREMRCGKPNCLGCLSRLGYDWNPKLECEGSDKLREMVPAMDMANGGGMFQMQGLHHVVRGNVRNARLWSSRKERWSTSGRLHP